MSGTGMRTEQRKKAIVSAVMLAAMAIAIYAVVLLKYFIAR